MSAGGFPRIKGMTAGKMWLCVRHSLDARESTGPTDHGRLGVSSRAALRGFARHNDESAP